jgi:large subunit ribosomal protein L15
MAESSKQITLSQLNAINAEIINRKVLQELGLIKPSVNRVKVILSGKINKKVTLSGINVTKGAHAAITAAGGKIEG